MFNKNSGQLWLTAAVLAGALLAPPVALAETALSLEQAIARAQRNDPWLAGNTLQQQALEAQSVAAGTLPDPVVSLGVANLPVDTFDFAQEPMTQAKIGISQQFPRGASRSLQRKQLALLGEQHPLQREDRRARVAVSVAQLWLEAYRARQSIRLIEQDRVLFEQLVEVAQRRYSNALGHTRQQDLVRAKLEVTRLEDRLVLLRQRFDSYRAKLSEWLGLAVGSDGEAVPSDGAYTLDEAWPQVALRHPEFVDSATSSDPQALLPYFLAHPAIKSLAQKIQASAVAVELARQQYKPQWGVNASYAQRDADPLGNERADFVSFGLTFDLPIFTAKRQDNMLQSALAGSEATKTEKALALRQMLAAFATEKARLRGIEQRRALFQTRLLAEVHQQVEATLTAYTRDNGDFAEVVRARIAELNTRIEALDIEIDRLQSIVQLNYFFSRAGNHSAGESL